MLVAFGLTTLKAAEKAVEKPSLVTEENYNKIQVGMTDAEVKEILGASRAGMTSGNTHTSTWFLEKNDTKRHVEVRFQDKKVVSKSTNIKWAELAAKANEAAVKTAAGELKANFEKLRPGMVESEVEAIMGRPTAREVASGGRSGFVWLPESKFAFVIFQDGKATEMDSSETPPKNHDINATNVHRIVLGMDIAAVQAIFGPEQQKDGKHGNERYFWRQGNQHLTVVMRNDKVELKTSSVDKESLVHFEKSTDDKLETAIANLSSPEKAKVRAAFDVLGRTPIDPARASEVSRLLEKHVTAKEPFIDGLVLKWTTKDSADYYIKILEHPGGKGATDRNEHLRLALQVVGKLKVPEAVPPTVKLLKSFFERDDAAYAVRQMGPELTKGELLKYDNDANREARNIIEEIVEEFKDGGGSRLAAHLKDLKNPSPELRWGAAGGIGKMYVHPARRKEVAAALAAMLTDDNGTVVQLAAESLIRWGGSENEPALMATLSGKAGEIRMNAAKALGAWGTAAALPALEPLAADKDKRVAAAADDAIAAIKGRK